MDQPSYPLGNEIAEGDVINQHQQDPIPASDLPEPESMTEWKELPCHPPKSVPTPKVRLEQFPLVPPLNLLRELLERWSALSKRSRPVYGLSTNTQKKSLS
jgi:hypothetical protein